MNRSILAALLFLCACAADVVTPGEREPVVPSDDPEEEAEDILRRPEHTPPLNACEETIADFVACADHAAWLEAGLEALPSSQTSGWGPCYGCHEGGLGIELNRDAMTTFERFPFERLVQCEYDAGAVVGLEPTEWLQAYGYDPGDHPNYALTPNVSAALDGFVQATIACALPEG